MAELQPIERARNSLAKLDRQAWSSFPDFMRPNIKNVASLLRIGTIPTKHPIPNLYSKLKPQVRELIFEAYNGIELERHSFVNRFTGEILVDEAAFMESDGLIEELLAINVGYHLNTQSRITNWVNMKPDVRALVSEFVDEACSVRPSNEDIFLVNNGYQRSIFTGSSLASAEYIFGLPLEYSYTPPMTEDQEYFNMLDSFFQESFALVTESVRKRSGNSTLFIQDIQNQKIYPPHEFSPLRINLGGLIVNLASKMGGSPWPIFNALKADTPDETEEALQEATGHQLNGKSILNAFYFARSLDSLNTRNLSHLVQDAQVAYQKYIQRLRRN